jgi:hypothetical protein
MAEAEPVRQSILQWALHALGPYAVLLPLAGLVSFLVALLLVWRGKGPLTGAGLILVVHVPLLVGLVAALQGTIASFAVIAMSDVAPKPAEVAEGISMALVAPLAGILLMLPSYAVAILGALLRSFIGADPPAGEKP